jgi:glutamate-1-semialdehyde 2,1-aminomutase
LAANLAEDHALDGHLLAGLEPSGVAKGLTGTMLPFHYNRIDELRTIVSTHGRELAAIVMEPARDEGPASGFLEEVRDLARQIGATLVFDEVTSGWRLNTGGIHRIYGVDPDVAVFAKAMGNGYPMAAVIGKRSVMEASQRSFISSTSWTEKIGPVAAIATIRKHRDRKVPEHLVAVGDRIQTGWRAAASSTGLGIVIGGILPLSHFAVDGKESAALMTLFTQGMLDRGFLASGQLYASYAHEPQHIDAYLNAVGEVFATLARAATEGDVSRHLRGPVKHSGFQRLT